jgi:hypothetical protein
VRPLKTFDDSAHADVNRMNSYRALKAKEVELALAALQERLEKCPRANGQHVIVLERLEALLATFANELLTIQPVIHDAGFQSLVDYTVNRISSFLFIVETQYLRGLLTPSSEELFLRSIFLNCTKRLGLHWIEDMAVQGTGELAIYPELGSSLNIPAFHIPTGLLDSFLSLPGVYHEFGHSVFARCPSILATMQQVVRTHFQALIQQLGPMQPAIRAAQLKRFEQAEEFWTDRCLEELFCDLFAQYIGGCANIVSMIDLSMAKGRPTYDMDSLDYPPDAARVRVCASSLTTDQATEASTGQLLAEWEEYAQQFSDSQFYRDACGENLLKQLGQTVFTALASEMPNLPKHEASPPDVKVAFTPAQTLSFEDAIQQGCTVLAWNRDNFESWWQDARTRLV